MRKNKMNVLFANFLIMLLILNVFQFNTLAVDAASDEEVFAKLKDRGFKEEVNLGMPVTGAVLTSAVFGVEDGRQIAYTTANGGMFSAVDVVKNEVLFTAQLTDISAVWSHSVASDGTVYIAGLSDKNIGTLWSYSPKDKAVTNHGVADASHQFWSSTTDDDGNVYIGTYKEGEGKIFKYDKSLNAFVDFGKIDMDGDSSYVRSLAYHDGYIYAGLGVTGNVYKINAVDPTEKENITKNVPELIGSPHEDIGFAYDMSIVGDYLAVRFNDTAAILFYDIKAENWVADAVIGKKSDGSEEDFGSFGFTQLAVHNNKTYVINDRKILEVDVETLETRETDIAYPAGWRGAIFADFGEADEEDMRLVTFQRNGELLSFNITDKTRESFPLAISGDQPMDLHNLGLGPDGNLYMTTYPGGPRGAQYNTKTGAFQSYAQGQAEGMIAGNGSDMFFGIYTGAVIQKMDTDTLKMKTLFNLNDVYEQDRPYIMKFENDKLLIGTIPDYQKLGGTLTIYDPDTEERETYRNVVQDHSIVGLATKDGKIYGSTTIRGGLDIAPTADNAKMFVWDIDGKKKITDFEIELPGLGKSPMISGLTFDDEGLLWGAVDGFIFAMNPDTYEIVKHKNIYPNIVNRGMWRPVHIHFGDDGLLYTDIGGKLAVVDSKSPDLEHVSLIDSGDELSFMELAYDAEGNQNIYYINHKNFLKMIPVIDGGKLPVEPEYETANVQMTNPGFEEELNANGSIPGWSSLFADITDNVSFEVTDEKVKSGTSSLKVTDKSPDETVFVQSDLIPIEAGIEYTGSVEMYLEDGSASFFLRYFDEEGKQVGVDKDGVNIIHVRSGHGNWQTVTATVNAPEDAKFAKLFVGASKFFQTTGAHYDDFQLTYQKEVIPTEPEEVVKTALENLVTEAESKDETDYTTETWEVFAAALTQAKTILADEDATQEAVDAALATLREAIDGLVENPILPEEVVKTALENLVTEVDSKDETDYTTETWEVFVAALAQAKTVLADEDATQEAVDAALATLKAAVEGLAGEPVEPTDPEEVVKTALENLVTEADSKDETDYTTETWEVFVAALAQAKIVMADEDATQEEVDTALVALGAAVDGLAGEPVEPTDPEEVVKTVLENLVTEADSKDEADYTTETWEVFEAALAQAKEVLADENATQEAVDVALATLREAIEGLEESPVVPEEVVKTALEKQITEADSKDEADYTTETWKVFEAALAQAKEVLADEDATQEAVDEALAALGVAVEGLEENPIDPVDPVDPTDPIEPAEIVKTALEKLITEADSKDETNYTTETWKAFTAALAQAKTVLADENATQEAVDAALATLEAAIESLEESPVDPIKPVNPTDKDNGGGVIIDKDNLGDKLPSTATNIFNLMGVGVLLLIGAGLLFLRRKRSEKA